MTREIVENAVITETINPGNILTGLSLATVQADFLLNEADFMRLKGEGSKYANWALNILFATIGYGFSILPKWISEIAGKPEKVSQSEWAAIGIGVAISLILYIVSRRMPNEKSKLLERMAQHFKSSPRSRQLIRDQQ